MTSGARRGVPHCTTGHSGITHLHNSWHEPFVPQSRREDRRKCPGGCLTTSREELCDGSLLLS